MKNIILISTVCFTLFYSSVHAIAKLDLGLYGSLGKAWGFLNADVDGDGLKNRQVNANQISFGMSIDFINVTALTKPYYGMGFGLMAGVQIMDQWFGSLNLSNDQTDLRVSPGIMNTMLLELTPVFRFHPSREVSLGIGPSFGISLTKGQQAFIETAAYSNDTDGYKLYYISPSIADMITVSALIDASITKFIGNFGLYFGANVRIYFPVVALGIEGKFGFKYRFDI